eukprot:5125205-Pleurochrysis_carterae.AAC.1
MITLASNRSTCSAAKARLLKQFAHCFMCSFTALLNRNRREGATRVTGTFHSDNAGEFYSAEFASCLNANGVNSTTCPPHVHQLNGAAERAIRSIMNLTRAPMVTSGALHSFWDNTLSRTLLTS